MLHPLSVVFNHLVVHPLSVVLSSNSVFLSKLEVLVIHSEVNNRTLSVETQWYQTSTVKDQKSQVSVVLLEQEEMHLSQQQQARDQLD